MFDSIDFSTTPGLLAGALAAGFATGFAGFGTGLVASGLWFHVLPAAMVPPLAALTSVAAQLVGLLSVRAAFDWRRLSPYLAGAVLGVPVGVATLGAASPDALRTGVGAFLLCYGAYQLSGAGRRIRLPHRGGVADGVVGAGGGFLGGFAGLSGPLPIIWLQLQGGSIDGQRAVYQPFNLLVLAFAGAGMLIGGQMNTQVFVLFALCLPVTLLGARIGVVTYRRVAARTFQYVVLALLLTSGAILVGRSMLGRG